MKRGKTMKISAVLLPVLWNLTLAFSALSQSLQQVKQWKAETYCINDTIKRKKFPYNTKFDTFLFLKTK